MMLSQNVTQPTHEEVRYRTWNYAGSVERPYCGCLPSVVVAKVTQSISVHQSECGTGKSTRPQVALATAYKSMGCSSSTL